MRDSTVVKRTVKKRVGVPEPIKSVAKDIASGFGELQRQTGAAVDNIKARYRKVKSFVSK